MKEISKQYLKKKINKLNKKIHRAEDQDDYNKVWWRKMKLDKLKNKLKKITQIYSLPKNGGNYQAKKIGSIDTKSIVTGADFDKKTNTLALTSTILFERTI